jgi:multiple sugar transport system substrate-binding protein
MYREGLNRRAFLRRLSAASAAAAAGPALLLPGVQVAAASARRFQTSAPEITIDDFTSANIDWQQAQGEELIFGVVQHPWTTAIEPLLPMFTELTGITVTQQIASETEFLTNLAVTLGGGSSTPDLFMMLALGQYATAQWIEPLDDYLTDSDLTDANWYDTEDIFTASFNYPVFAADNQRYAMAITAEAMTPFLRGDLMDEQGLDIPETFDELYELAGALKTEEIAGIAMRGKPTNDAVTAPGSGFIWSYGGQIIDEDGQIAFDSDEAIAGVEMYGRMLRDHGPTGVASYHWYEVVTDFQQGQVAIACDSSTLVPQIEDPELSQVAGQARYGTFPRHGDLPARPFASHWMLGMNARSEHKTAAWLLMEFLTSKPGAIITARGGATPPRTTAWQDPAFVEQYGEQAAEAAMANIQAGDPTLVTRAIFHPQWPEIGDYLAVAFNQVITGSASAEDALTEAANRSREVLENF